VVEAGRARRRGVPREACGVLVGLARRGEAHDPRPHDQLVRHGGAACQFLQSVALGSGQAHVDGGGHAVKLPEQKITT